MLSFNYDALKKSKTEFKWNNLVSALPPLLPLLTCLLLITLLLLTCLLLTLAIRAI